MITKKNVVETSMIHYKKTIIVKTFQTSNFLRFGANKMSKMTDINLFSVIAAI